MQTLYLKPDGTSAQPAARWVLSCVLRKRSLGRRSPCTAPVALRSCSLTLACRASTGAGFRGTPGAVWSRSVRPNHSHLYTRSTRSRWHLLPLRDSTSPLGTHGWHTGSTLGSPLPPARPLVLPTHSVRAGLGHPTEDRAHLGKHGLLLTRVKQPFPGVSPSRMGP